MLDIDALTAGPELDRLIGEKVMGWACKDAYGCDGLVWFDASGSELIDYGPTAYGWSPSTNIAHAWEVVERVRLQDYGSLELWWDAGAEWWCALFRFKSETPEMLTADTAPLAICRAALKAIALSGNFPATQCRRRLNTERHNRLRP